MSPPRPRKLRSGRRQFPGGPAAGPGGPHGGTDQEWEHVMSRPDVQKALRDPAIQQALYHNLQSSVPGGMASVVPPPGGPPMGMQGGGTVDSTLTPQQAAERAAGSRSPAQVAQMQRLGFNPGTASPGDNRPLRFQGGGQLATDPEIQKWLNNPDVPENLKAPVRLAIVKQQTGATGIPGVASGQTMSGLGNLGAAGPATPGNTAAAMGVGALMGLGTTRMQGLSALVGAGTAGLLNYFIRKYGKGAQAQQQQKQQQQQANQANQARAGIAREESDPNLNKQPPGTGAAVVSPKATTPVTPVNAAPKSPDAPTPVPPAKAWDPNWRTPQDTSTGSQASTTDTTTDTTTAPGVGRSMWMGTANSASGNVLSYDGGKTWLDQQTKKPYTGGDVLNQQEISPSSSLTNATRATTQPVTTADLLNLPSEIPSEIPTALSGLGSTGVSDLGSTGASDLGSAADYLLGDNYEFSQGGEFAEGGMPPASKKKAVLLRKPMGMPIPILHTTIVIAAKPKADKKKSAKSGKKQTGGVIRPAKPHLLPPLRGPQDHEDRPRAHGRVQVPRGSGAAIRGKRFGGIF